MDILIPQLNGIFHSVVQAPKKANVTRFNKIVTDRGDSHVLASCSEEKVDFLVTLDKKHLLVLQDKIKWVNIVTPKELIELFKEKLRLDPTEYRFK